MLMLLVVRPRFENHQSELKHYLLNAAAYMAFIGMVRGLE